MPGGAPGLWGERLQIQIPNGKGQFLYVYAYRWTTPPPAPTLSASGVDLGAEVDFEACYDSDVLGGNVYSSTSSGGPYQKANSQTIYASGSIHYTVTGLQNGVTYYLVATLVDQMGNEGAYSNEVAVTPGP